MGKKAVEFCRQRGLQMVSDEFAVAEDISVSDSLAMAKLLCADFLAGEYDQLFVCYTNFVSMLSQSPATH